jgi:uncharacterized repeat protein (TIGR03803 family)
MKSRSYARLLILIFAVLAVMVLSGGSAHAGNHGLRTLYTFQGGSDGLRLSGLPSVDKDGNLYGVTESGGEFNYGTIYKLTAPQTRDGTWTKTIIYNCSFYEAAPLFVMVTPSGDLYGATFDNDIFRLRPPKPHQKSWRYTLLYTLNAESDGSGIANGFQFDREGNIYGVAGFGGGYECEGNGCGTVFELKRPKSKSGGWQCEVLHVFKGVPDGGEPFDGPTFDRKGNLWGTTMYGGSYNDGTVYRLRRPQYKGGRWTETIIYAFDGSDYIMYPRCPVTFDKSGNLYSATTRGGDFSCNENGDGCGVVFELTSQKATHRLFHTLYEFNDEVAFPQATLAIDARGNLYGMTLTGDVYELSFSSNASQWKETVLGTFYDKDGYVADGLTWGKWHNLYGVTVNGGSNEYGTIFKVRP